MKNLLILSLLLCGCPHPPNPQPVTPPDQNPPVGVPNCPATMTVGIGDVCGGLFTKEGLACASCQGGLGCFDQTDVIYCANGGCLKDPKCGPPPLTASDGGMKASTRKPRFVKVVPK